MPRDLKTVKLRMPRKLLRAMKRRIDQEGYASAGEYVCDLIRNDLRTQALGQINGKLPDAIDSCGVTSRVALWQQLHETAGGNGRPPGQVIR